MTTSQHPSLLLTCTLTFLLLLVIQTPAASSQAIAFTEEPRDSYFIVKRKPITVTCAARHAVDISFLCGGVKVPPTSVELEAFSEDDPEVVKASITVTRADVANYKKKGSYWCECQAIGYDGQVAATSTRGEITNAVMKYRFKKQPTTQKVIDGESVEFVCEPPVSHPKPEVFWKKDNRRINLDADDRLVLSDKGSLLIDSATGDDAGSYSCVVRNPAGRRESKKADLQVTVLSEATDAAEEDAASGAKSREERQTDTPFFSTEPKSVYYVKQGEYLTIDCGVTSANIITFRCNGVRTDRKKQSNSQGQDSDGNRIIQSQLKISYNEVMEFQRAGSNSTYQCQCVGWYQQNRSKWMSILSNKNVGVVKMAYLESEFKREPSDMIVGENTQATLKCEPPKGQPSPWVYWYKDGVKIDPRSDNSYRVSREGHLVIVSVQYSDTGRYKCVAENIVKSVESRLAELRVSATPPPPTTPTTTITTPGITIPSNIGDGPVFLQDLPDEVAINKQGVAKLTCISHAANMLSIDCNGRRLNQDEFTINREKNDETGKMILTLMSEVGAGDVRANPDGYWCRCTSWELDSLGKWKRQHGNKAYIVERKRTFIEEDFVYPPKDTEVKVQERVEIACEPPKGDPMPTVYWLKDGDIVKPEMDSNLDVLQAGTLVIESARVEDQGMYVCVAENEAGTRRSEPATLTVMEDEMGGDNCHAKLMECQQLMQSFAEMRPELVCGMLEKAKMCFMDLQCPAEVQENIDIALNEMEKASAMCAAAGQNGQSDCLPELAKCQEHVKDAQEKGGVDAFCGALEKVRMCLEGLNCPEEMHTVVGAAMQSLEKSKSLCVGQGGLNTPSTTDYYYESTTMDFDMSSFSGPLEPFFTEEPEPVSYILSSSQSVTLRCTVIAADTLMFACNGKTLRETGTTGYVTNDASGHSIRDNSLTITAQQVEAYQGAEPYSCVCKGYSTREETKEWYSVDSRPGVIQKAFLDYDFIQEPMSKEAMGGEMVTLMCVPPQGVPKPTVNWIHDGFMVSESDNVMITDDGSLVIKGFVESDQGEYMCSAQNILGQRTSQSALLSVKSSDGMVSTSQPDMTSDSQPSAEPTPEAPYRGEPFISKDLHSVYYVTKKKEATIVCQATAVNDVSLECIGLDMESMVTKTATVKEMELEDGTTDEVNIVEATLVITEDDLYDAGDDDDFYCVCRGHYDNEGTMGTIDSQEAFVEFAYLKKRFAKEPENVQTEAGNFLTLTCQPPMGNPEPEITWMKDGAPLERIQVTPGILAIEYVTMADGGEYTCVAENVAARRTSAPFLVEVLPGSGMTTPDDVIGTGDGTDMDETATDDTGLEVEVITKVPLTSDSTDDENSTRFNGWESTTAQTVVDSTRRETSIEQEASTSGGFESMNTSPTGEMSGSTVSPLGNMDTSSSTTKAMMMSNSEPTSSTQDETSKADVDDDMMDKQEGESTEDMMMEKGETSTINMMEGKEGETTQSMMDKDDTTEDMMVGTAEPNTDGDNDDNTDKDMDMAKEDNDGGNQDPTDSDDSSDENMDKSTDDEYMNNMGESTPEPEPTSFPAESTTPFDNMQTCEEVMNTCSESSNQEGDKSDMEKTCNGANSYLKCMSGFLKGCSRTLDAAVIMKARENYNMMKAKCEKFKPMGGEEGDGGMTKDTEDEGASTQASIEDCEDGECGAASIGVSILLISLLQFVLAFFITEQR